MQSVFPIVGLIVMFGVLGGALAWGLRMNKLGARLLRERFLAELAGNLDEAGIDDLKNVASGRAGGAAVTARFAFRPAGKTQAPWTEVEITTTRTPLQLWLRSEKREASFKARGLAVDVETGDAEFDRRYLVEAAPTDVIKTVLDPELRSAISALGEVAITTKGPGHYFIERRLHERLPELLALAGGLAHRVDHAHATANHAQQTERGGPFRAEAATTDAGEREALRAAELAQLAKVKARRKEHDRTKAWLVALALLGFIVLLVLFRIFVVAN